MAMKNILLTGASGQLGLTLQSLWPSSGLEQEYNLIPLSRTELDITNSSDISSAISQYQPTAVINASAYTAVDAAQTDREAAYRINESGPRTLASACKEAAARLVHVSTDFVFDGDQRSKVKTPYLSSDFTSPSGVYGESKLAGEIAISEECREALIIRTSWLYSEYKSNFVKTMLRLMKERDSLGVVSDQIGAPTSTLSLGRIIFTAIKIDDVFGIYHWSDSGSISWFEFAEEIQQVGLSLGILNKRIPIAKLTTQEYPTPAKRPSYSVLDCSRTISDFSVAQEDWKKELRTVIQRIAEIGE